MASHFANSSLIRSQITISLLSNELDLHLEHLTGKLTKLRLAYTELTANSEIRDDSSTEKTGSSKSWEESHSYTSYSGISSLLEALEKTNSPKAYTVSRKNMSLEKR